MLFRNWEIFKFKTSPINIPVSQIVNFICDLLNSNYDKNKKIALLCSTGNRSLALAKVLEEWDMIIFGALMEEWHFLNYNLIIKLANVFNFNITYKARNYYGRQ